MEVDMIGMFMRYNRYDFFNSYNERQIILQPFSHNHHYNNSRENVIDWDYHTSVKTVASIVHQNEFLHWRMTGVGFQFGDKTYSVSNKTNATFINGAITKGHERGLVKPIQGYWLDILIGPYICFGIASDQNDKRSDLLFQVINKGTGAEQHRHNASEVSLYNIISLMWALEVSYNDCYDSEYGCIE
jgi:dynein assembly factor 3